MKDDGEGLTSRPTAGNGDRNRWLQRPGKAPSGAGNGGCGDHGAEEARARARDLGGGMGPSGSGGVPDSRRQRWGAAQHRGQRESFRESTDPPSPLGGAGARRCSHLRSQPPCSGNKIDSHLT